MKQILTLDKIVFLLIYVCFCMAMPHPYNPTGDDGSFTKWSINFFKNGLENAYSSGTDYPPLFQYVIWMYVNFQPTLEAVAANIKQLRYIILVFDFLGVMVVYQLLKDFRVPTKEAFILSLFLLFNIGYLYNTVMWGQVDAIYTTMLFIAVYLAYNKQVLGTILFCVLAINAKFYSFIFFPLILVLIIPSVIEKFSIKNLLIWVGSAALLQFLLILPFYLNGDVPYIRHILFDQALHRKENLSGSAYNMWFWVAENPFESDSNARFLGVKFKAWGFVMYVLSYFMMILPVFLMTLNNIFGKVKIKIELSHFLLVCIMIPIIFLFFPTQMHGRYVHASIIFAAAYAFLNRKYTIYIIISLAYFLSMHDVIKFKFINTGWIIYDPRFIAFLYAICIVLIYKEIYQGFNKWLKVYRNQ
jgi:Gpi18-like mannosyltransferase